MKLYKISKGCGVKEDYFGALAKAAVDLGEESSLREWLLLDEDA